MAPCGERAAPPRSTVGAIGEAPLPGSNTLRPRRLHRIARRLGLPPGCWFDGALGLRADLEGGLLVGLAWWSEGAPLGLRLELDPSRRRGCLRQPEGSGGTEDTEVYRGGRVERFDAWSDNERPRAMSWSRWSDGAVARVMGGLGCLLCGAALDRAPAAAHTPQGQGHLCSPCLERVAAESPVPRSWPRGERRCGACGGGAADEGLLYEGPGGRLCPDCSRGLLPVRRGLW